MREVRPHGLEAGDEAWEVVPVHPTEMRLVRKLVLVRVEDPLVPVQHSLHGTANRLAVDSGARVGVVDVAVIVERAVAGEEDQPFVLAERLT